MNVAPVMQSTLSTFKKSTKLMGNLFEITAVGEDQLNAETQIQGAIDEIKRIEVLLTKTARQIK